MGKQGKRGLIKKIAKSEIKKESEKLGRKLTKKEVHQIVRGVKVKVRIGIATLLLGATGLAGVAGAAMLNPGQEDKQPETTTETTIDKGYEEITNNIETIETETHETTQKIEEEKTQETEEEKTKEETTFRDQIVVQPSVSYNLNSQEEVLKFLKQKYVEEYNAKTDGEKISSSQVKIYFGEQSYVNILDDGTIVTHGSAPAYTKKEIEENDRTIVGAKNNVDAYRVVVDGETIDCMVNVDGKLQVAIPGDKFEEFYENPNTIVCDMGKIFVEGIELIDLYDEFEKTNGNFVKGKCDEKKKDLISAIISYSKDNNREHETEGRD